MNVYIHDYISAYTGRSQYMLMYPSIYVDGSDPGDVDLSFLFPFSCDVYVCLPCLQSVSLSLCFRCGCLKTRTTSLFADEKDETSMRFFLPKREDR